MLRRVRVTYAATPKRRNELLSPLDPRISLKMVIK